MVLFCHGKLQVCNLGVGELCCDVFGGQAAVALGGAFLSTQQANAVNGVRRYPLGRMVRCQ